MLTDALRPQVQAARALRVKQYASLVFGYQALMGGDGDAEMSRDVFALVVQGVNGQLSGRQADVLFDLLDVDRSGAITVAEFLRLPAALALARRLPELPEPHVATAASSQSGSCLRLQTWEDTVSWCRRVVASRLFRVFTGFAVVGSCVCACLWTWTAQTAYDACVCAPDTPPASDDAVAPGAGAAGAPCPSTPGSGCSSNLVFVGYALSLAFVALQAVEIGVRIVAHGCGRCPRRAREQSGCAAASCGGWARSTWLFASGWNVLAAVVISLNLVAAPLLLYWPATGALAPTLRDLLQLARALLFLRLLELQVGTGGDGGV